MAEKYDHIDMKPSAEMRDAAQRALDVRRDKPESQRGMTPVGLARARDIIDGDNLSPDTWRRMLSFFQRHEVDKKGKTWDDKGKGWQAWYGWGGDAGFARARKIVKQMDSADKKKASNMIKKEGDKWILYTQDGSRKLGEHPTKEAAKKQEEAIKASEAARNSVVLVSNVSKSQIRDTKTHWEIIGAPITVDDSIMNGRFYPAEENRKGLPSLLGQPIVLSHPIDSNGEDMVFVKGEGLDDYYAGGTVTNVYNRNGVNYADLKIKKSLLEAQDGSEWYVDALNGRKPIGLSTGLAYTPNDMAGDGYYTTAIDQVYGHLAMLDDKEPPAGGKDTMMVFNSADRVTVVNHYLPAEDATLIDKVVNSVLSKLGIVKPESYNKPDGSPEQAANSNQPDGSNAVDKKKMMSLMENMGMDMSKVNEDMGEEDMYNMMSDYAKNMGKASKNEDDEEKMKKEEEVKAKNAQDSEILKTLNAINSRLDAIEQKDPEADMLVNFVSDRVGISKESCAAMNKADLTKMASQHGYVNVNTVTSTPAVNSQGKGPMDMEAID